MKTPITYWGGKQQIAGKVIKLFPAHRIYNEPFFGGEDVLHYCDPPYFNSDCGHYDGYSEEDFTALLDCLSAVKGKFVLSSYPSEVLDRYVEKYGWRQERIEMARSAGFCEGVKVEVLTWNFEDSCGKQGELFE